MSCWIAYEILNSRRSFVDAMLALRLYTWWVSRGSNHVSIRWIALGGALGSGSKSGLCLTLVSYSS